MPTARRGHVLLPLHRLFRCQFAARAQAFDHALGHVAPVDVDRRELEHAVELKVGETLSLSISPVSDPEERSVHVDYQSLVKDLKSGDKVTVEMSPYDLTRGRITYRFK